ncbi:MAG: hypothetical protein ACRD96_00280 [Bryobacteraceae bacterium]
MKDFENELRAALARQEPSPDFAARVASRTRGRRAGWWTAWAVAASLVVSVAGVSEYRRYQGRKAKEQLLQALSITSDKLRLVGERIHLHD